jgi:hypothetical protein
MNWDMISACSDVAGVVAVVVSLLYLSRQVRMSNQLARAEASRSPTSDLNMLNASFGVNPSFQSALCRGIEGVERPGFQPDERVLLDLYFVSVTNIYEQLVREVREGILDQKALDFGGKGLFELPFYRTSWPILKPFLSTSFTDEFERRYSLDPNISTVYWARP